MNYNGTNTLPLHIHDDNNGLGYTLHGDYYLPDLEVPPTISVAGESTKRSKAVIR